MLPTALPERTFIQYRNARKNSMTARKQEGDTLRVTSFGSTPLQPPNGDPGSFGAGRSGGGCNGGSIATVQSQGNSATEANSQPAST